MPEGPDGKTIIIVKKVSGHGGHHGGAWKVAFADFVTAMMALFMVLWLVNSAAEPTRDRIASYFRKPGIFQKGSGNPMEMGGGGILPETFSPPTDGNAQIQVS
ncbi:MAG TPA: flagellar motor protein MotB, partial [Oligoflexia bacterium]|nr:flagellar motor protein MotB [Oligoflexia bacterium]